MALQKTICFLQPEKKPTATKVAKERDAYLNIGMSKLISIIYSHSARLSLDDSCCVIFSGFYK